MNVVLHAEACVFVVEKTAAVSPVAETTSTPGIRHVIFLVYRLSMICVQCRPQK